MCNINQAEIAYRKKAMWFGIELTTGLFLVAIILPISVWARLILIVPIYIASIGYLQVVYKFCVAYGASGKQNAREGSDVASNVVDSKARAIDKTKARDLNLRALGMSLVMLALLMLVPNLTTL